MNPEDVAMLVTIKDIERYVVRRGFNLSKVEEGPAVGMIDIYVQNISFDAAELLEYELRDRVSPGLRLTVRIDAKAGPYRFGLA